MTNMGGLEFLYIDMFLIMPVAIFSKTIYSNFQVIKRNFKLKIVCSPCEVSANKAYEKLVLKRPLGSLVGFVNVSSIAFQIILVVVFQFVMAGYLTKQTW